MKAKFYLLPLVALLLIMISACADSGSSAGSPSTSMSVWGSWTLIRFNGNNVEPDSASRLVLTEDTASLTSLRGGGYYMALPEATKQPLTWSVDNSTSTLSIAGSDFMGKYHFSFGIYPTYTTLELLNDSTHYKYTFIK